MATIPTFVLTYGANPYKRSESILGLLEAQATGFRDPRKRAP
jgi:hypothetical protein